MRTVLTLSASLFVTTTALAFSAVSPAETLPGYFEIIGAGSSSSVDSDHNRIRISSNETDSLIQTNENKWNSWGGQLGIGYVYFLNNAEKYSDHVQWFPMFEPEINVYYNHYKNSGDVYRFESSAFNELKYNMTTESTRVMFDGALTVVSWRPLSTYVIAGIGGVWNHSEYSDRDNANVPCNLQNFTLNGHARSHFAWEAGVGESYDINNRLRLSFEYLYTDLGRITISNTGSLGDLALPLSASARFNLHTQALLLGLHVKI